MLKAEPFQSLFGRLVQGDDRHKSRLHDFEGNLAGGGLIRSAWSTTCFKLGHPHQVPWINYPAISRLQSILGPDSKVVEFGSGFSTIWLAKRCARVVTIESNAAWFASISSRVDEKVDMRLCTQPDDYCLVSGCQEKYFDLAIVDGDWRDRAMRRALDLVKPGGHIYLDNSDVQDTQHQTAKRLLLEAGREIEILIGMTPFQFTTTQGVLARI
jgi:hypothetical protein